MRVPFFWRLYAALAMLVIVTAVGIGALIIGQLQRGFTEQIAVRLRTEAAALVPLAFRAFADGEDVQRLVNDVGRSSSTRVTLIAPDGRVVADSGEQPARMENHGDRPELVAAFRDGTGMAQRFSDTLRRNFMYVAVRVDRDDAALGAVRVAVPLSEIDAEMARLRREVIRGAAISMLAALALGAFVAFRLSTPIVEMTRVSEALRRGDYGVRVRHLGQGEVRTLAENFNRLADELAQRIASLEAHGAQFDTIIRSMQEGLVAVDGDGRVVVSNAAGRQLLHLPEEGEQRLTPAVLERVPAMAALLEAVRRSGEPAQQEITVPDDSGGVVLDTRAAPFAAESSSGVLLVLYNVTHLRRLERVRTDFVANVSHELKTPLTSIHGYVETLLDGAVHDARNNVRFLEKIRTQVGRLSALVADLLSLARIESPAAILRSETVDWRDIASDSINQRRDRIADQQLRLTFAPGDRAVEVIGDREAMRQVIDNLIDNAIAYTPDGGAIQVSVRAEGNAGVVEVADTGFGIPADALDRIFERFYRVDHGRARSLGGTGLGLSIVRNLLQRMHGTVRVSSQIGKGSIFTVTLPLATGGESTTST